MVRAVGAGASTGLLGWLTRLVAGKELSALRAHVAALSDEAAGAAEAARAHAARLEARLAAATAELQAERRRREELERRLAASSATPAVDEEALLAPLRLEIEQRAREQSDLEKTVARKESERREATAKLARSQQELEALDKRLKKAEATLRDSTAQLASAEERARRAEGRAGDALKGAAVRSQDAAREVMDLRHEVAQTKRRADDLAALTTQRQMEIAARDETIAALEDRLVTALGAATSDPLAIERALRDRDALIEELESALISIRMTDVDGTSA